MRNKYLVIAGLVLGQIITYAQNSPPKVSVETRPSAGGETQQAQQRSGSFDLTDYGVQIQPEPRLIVMMAALEAAGFDPTPGRKPTLFREQVRKDLANLDPDIKARLSAFYNRHKLKDPATPAEQAARYVSLAYALGALPTLEAPPRSDELPEGVLEVLDFAPLVREFYRKSGIADRLPTYIRAYQAEGDRLRRPAADMVRFVLSYLHTRPVMTFVERVPVPNPAPVSKKKDAKQAFTTRERVRRFLIVPDLLAVPGTINFRVVGDEYYAVVPPGINPAASDLRRAYLQYVIDPLLVRFNRDIAARRSDIRTLLEDRAKAGANVVLADVYTPVARSLVAAADVRMNETARLQILARETSARLQSAPEANRAAILKESQEVRAAIEDESIAQLAEAYEKGAVLAFYFADQLRGQETSGFDITSYFADMIASFNLARERARLNEHATARERAKAMRHRLQQMQTAANDRATNESDTSRRTALIESLSQVEELMRLKNYEEAETRLRSLMQEFQGEPRIFFALGQVASLSAEDAFDEKLQAARLNNALTNYRMALQAASPETDRALMSRAHTAMGRILEFLERNQEALKEFEAAIQIGDVAGGAFKEAMAGKNRLAQPK